MQKSKKSFKISVVIPTHNGLSTLLACVDSLVKQTLKPLEILVIDNASSDSTVRKIAQYIKKKKLQGYLKVIKNKRNLGVTGGRNTGISNASPKSNLILFFD